MVLKLFGRYASPWVRLAATAILEKKVPFELVSVDVANREQKSLEYLAKHPFGQIPYIACDSLDSCLKTKTINSIYLLLGFH